MQYALDAFERGRGNLPQLPVVNMFAEAVPVEEAGVVLQSRPPLNDRNADMGDGPVWALYQSDGVLNGALFGVSGKYLYQGTTQLGTVSGGGHASIAGNELGLMVTRGGSLKFYDGETLAVVDFPDAAKVTKTIVAGSRFVALRADSGMFYWTEPLESTFDGLAFATAENAPDALLDGIWLDGMLILFGRHSTEFWRPDADADLPFVPIQGRAYPVGVKNAGAVCHYANSVAWVGDDNVVYAPGQAPVRLSNPGIEEQIAASAEAKLFAFRLEGAEFLALRVDGATWVRSAVTGLWSRFESKGAANWLAQCWANGVFGSAEDGQTFKFGDGHADLAGELERRFRGGFALNGGIQQVQNIGLRLDVGNTPYTEGTFSEPTIEMRLSRDAGRTWGPWKPKSLGRLGEYRKRVQWRGLGIASQPGLLADFRCTDPVPLRISAVTINEPTGGR